MDRCNLLFGRGCHNRNSNRMVSKRNMQNGYNNAFSFWSNRLIEPHFEKWRFITLLLNARQLTRLKSTKNVLIMFLFIIFIDTLIWMLAPADWVHLIACAATYWNFLLVTHITVRQKSFFSFVKWFWRKTFFFLVDLGEILEYFNSDAFHFLIYWLQVSEYIFQFFFRFGIFILLFFFYFKKIFENSQIFVFPGCKHNNNKHNRNIHWICCRCTNISGSKKKLYKNGCLEIFSRSYPLFVF